MKEIFSFFVYDTVKIFILLTCITFLVSWIRTYFSEKKMRKILSHNNRYLAHGMASLLGIITPFCSCSAIPLFLGFIEAGVPLGVTFSFLISSPMINEVALVLLLSLFGWKIALLYVISGLVIAYFSGIILGRCNPEKWLTKIYNSLSSEDKVWNTKKRALYSFQCTRSILQRIWLFIILGVFLGAWIHGYVPVDFMAKWAGADKWYAVPLATLIGIPLYSNAAGVIPLVSALTEKGMSMGTALAFMMAVTGLSFPECMILKRVMQWKLLLLFVGIVGSGIVIVGYLFNAIVPT